MNQFGTLPLPSTIHRCTSALARSQYPKIDDVLDLMDGDDASRALAAQEPRIKKETSDV